MNPLKLRFLALAAAFLLASVCRAAVSAVVIIYQPIITAGEVVTVETSKGFLIMPIPFFLYRVHGSPPYHAIAQPNQILTDAPRSILSEDSNLLSRAGVRISGAFDDDDPVYVRFEDLRRPQHALENVTDDDIAEAALECIRRLAHDSKRRPKLLITGKEGDEAKWQNWQKHFEQHDLAKPFIRPNL